MEAPWGEIPFLNDDDMSEDDTNREDAASLVGFEDIGDALEEDNDYSFVLKLFAGCAVAR